MTATGDSTPARDVRVGVVGATGAVGRVTVELLLERGYTNVRTFASWRSAGGGSRNTFKINLLFGVG